MGRSFNKDPSVNMQNSKPNAIPLPMVDGARPSVSTEQAVRERYSGASQEREEALCCPVTYPTELLKAIPQEVIEKDYGCGDPTPFVKPGDTVLDLGSGGGKLCFISAQLAGPDGKVIGVDCNNDMLSLARRNKPEFVKNVGYDNVEFRCGLIQDLQLDLEKLAEATPNIDTSTVEGLIELRQTEQRLRQELTLIPDNSVDCVISNCVLNLVRTDDRESLFRELYRVLKIGGRAAISDIVCDEEPTAEMKADPTLWSGCLSGAWREDRFIQQFEQAGFYGIQVANWSAEPWQVVEGVEFRSMTVLALKGDDGPCLERHQAVIYRGPFESVKDDDDHTYYRGKRMAVCDRTFQHLKRSAFADQFVFIEPADPVPLDDASYFDCNRDAIRNPGVTKGGATSIRTDADECCGGSNCC